MRKSVEIIAVDEVDPKHETNISVNVISSTVDHKQPATLRFQLKNASDCERDYLAGDGTQRVFSKYESKCTSPGLVLVSRKYALQNGINMEALPDECQVLSVPSGGYLVMSMITLSPGESSSIDLDIYSHPENSAPCLPEGEFRFEEVYEYKSQKEVSRFDWGFTLQIQDG